jgi:hypothetical protein
MATTGSGPNGPRQVLPIIHQADVDNVSFITLEDGEASVISDELPHFKSVGTVDHVVRSLKAPTPVHWWNPTALDFARNSYSSETGLNFSRQLIYGCHDWSSAVSWAGPWGAGSVASASSSTICPLGRTDDRLSELVPKMMNQLQRLALANSVYELRELPTLVQMFRRREALARSLDSIYKWYSQRGPKGYALTKLDFVNAAKAFREGNLNWFFGISPTWGDVKAINKELRKPRSFRKNVTATIRDYETYPEYKTGTASNGGSRSFRAVRSRTRVFGARLTFNGNQEPYLTEFFNKWQQFEDRFIGANPAAIIWEAIPFSFAVDWFLSIDNLLDNLWLNNQPRHSVTYWKSVKDVFETTLQWQYISKYERPGLPGEVPIAEFTTAEPQTERLTRYKRQPSAAPNALSQLKPRAGTKQLYQLALLAIGIRGPLSGRTAR